MSTPRVHLEMLLGKMVRDPRGARVGRIFSVHAEIEGADCVIREYLLGAAALLQRLGIPHPGWEPLRVPWDQLDLTDPEHPCLRCSAAELAGR